MNPDITARTVSHDDIRGIEHVISELTKWALHEEGISQANLPTGGGEIYEAMRRSVRSESDTRAGNYRILAERLQIILNK